MGAQELLIYGFTAGFAGCTAVGVYPAVARLWMRLASRIAWYQQLKVDKAAKALDESFVDVKPRWLKAAYGLGPLAGGLVAFGLSDSALVALAGAAVGILLPDLWVRRMRRLRRRQFQSQLVDALMMMSSSLKAGLSIAQALEVVAEEMPPPCSQEIGLVIKEAKMGMALDETLNRLLRRMPSHDLQLIVTAILVARETGGDVTDVFGRLIETIRERQKIKEKVTTLTTMPRLQGLIMALIPVGFGLVVRSADPRFFDVFLRDPVGQAAAMIILGCWVVSVFLIWLFSRPPVM